jgi:radical SAM superfamily enzyme YgiQ (UPF0313 family)
MLTLVNTNRMVPAIAPLGLEYVAEAARRSGLGAEVLDLALADDPMEALRRHFASRSPRLVGLSFRNVDDSYWPSAQSFVADLAGIVRELRGLTEAPLVVGGVGFSIFAEAIVSQFGVDFGVRGDGEHAIVRLGEEVQGARRFDRVPGLLWQDRGSIRANAPAWPVGLALPNRRDIVDNPTYLSRGGQIGLETKRGCDRMCAYCADPLAKGTRVRTRAPAEVAGEAEALLGHGVDVLHLCDSEFNVPPGHALAVCEEFARRNLGSRLRWYAYLATTPFTPELAQAMRRAGCVGINFTADSASPAMLGTYRQLHGRETLAEAVRLCREHGIAIMLDLLLGGPGETPQTAAETVEFVKDIGPDCAGAALGLRLYPGTEITGRLLAGGPLESNPGIWRKYEGPVDFLLPTFYLSPALGPQPARLVRDLIAGDPRFFEPSDPDSAAEQAADHNYNRNEELVRAIASGERGAYWDILRRIRVGSRGG